MSRIKPALCIYHGNCADGFGSAWVVRKYFRDVLHEPIDFYAGVYQNPPPDVLGRVVYMVDFSYKADVLTMMAMQASRINVIDHHKTAEAELVSIKYVPKIYAVFDMEKSGAGLTWDTLFPDQPRPELINYIEDRDLWKFKLDKSREVSAALFSYPYDFDIWDDLMTRDILHIASEGVVIDRKHFKDIEELLNVVVRPMVIGGYTVPVANLPYTMGSDSGHILCNWDFRGAKPPFAAYYYDTPEGRNFGMRSIEGGADVSEIAKKYGGGGHKHAAGFGESPSLMYSRGAVPSLYAKTKVRPLKTSAS